MRGLMMLLAGVGFMFIGIGTANAAENPEYVTWAKCKTGSSITMVMTSEIGGETSKTEIKSTLVEVTAEKCVIEIAQRVEAGGKTMDVPVQKSEVPRNIAGAGPAPATTGSDNPKITDEEVTVAAGKFKAKLTQTSYYAGANKSVMKTWTSDEVPGATVKMEATTEGPMKSKSTTELVKIDKK